jgi:hypothetical protein
MEMRRVREKLKRKKKDLERMRGERDSCLKLWNLNLGLLMVIATKTEDPALDGSSKSAMKDGRPSAWWLQRQRAGNEEGRPKPSGWKPEIVESVNRVTRVVFG